MSLYAIGDVQGCAGALDRLLDDIRFDATCDHVVFVGDLVNRGPDSAAVMERVLSLGDAASCVLGNHDLNTLAVAEGVRPLKPRDTVGALLESPSADAWLAWLRRQPLALSRDGYMFAHAGIYPLWDAATALERAGEVQTALTGDGYRDFLAAMFGAEPAAWDDGLSGMDRLRFITNAFTRMRYVDAKGALDLEETGPPGGHPTGLWPWFRVPVRRALTETVVFGHWSSLGYYTRDGVIGLDTGCVWGGQLTAVRLAPLPVISRCIHCLDA